MFEKLDIVNFANWSASVNINFLKKKDHYLDYDEFCLIWEDKYILNQNFKKVLRRR